MWSKRQDYGTNLKLRRPAPFSVHTEYLESRVLFSGGATGAAIANPLNLLPGTNCLDLPQDASNTHENISDPSGLTSLSDGPLKKIGTELARLYQMGEVSGSNLPIRNGAVLVNASAVGGDLDQLSSDLASLGALQVQEDSVEGAVSALVPIGALGQVAQLSSLVAAHAEESSSAAGAVASLRSSFAASAPITGATNGDNLFPYRLIPPTALPGSDLLDTGTNSPLIDA